MKLTLRRDQFLEEVGLFSKTAHLRYRLYVRLELSSAEEAASRKYGMSKDFVVINTREIKPKEPLPEGSSSPFQLLSLSRLESGVTFISESSLFLRKLEGEIRVKRWQKVPWLF